MQVARFARYHGQSPELLGPENIRTYQLHLIDDRQLAPTSVAGAVAALRFLYQVTLQAGLGVEALPLPKRGDTLPVVLSPEEVVRFLDAVARPKHRMILTTCYAAGLRLGEALRLQVTNVDSGRMVLHVEQGKGARDRYVMLSPTLLEQLRNLVANRAPGPMALPGTESRAADAEGGRPVGVPPCPVSQSVGQTVTPHSLRHAFAVHLLEVGTDVRTIQLLLGHRRLETTARYLRLATTKVCSATSPLDLLPRSETAAVPTR